MKKHLPVFHHPKARALSVGRRLRDLEFPNITRFITERRVLPYIILYCKIFIVSFISGFLFINILLQTVILVKSLKQLELARQQRMNIFNEIVYWKNISTQYSDYRDVYYRLATLEYEVGNISESKRYMQKALELDPNFGEGKVLGAKIGL